MVDNLGHGASEWEISDKRLHLVRLLSLATLAFVACHDLTKSPLPPNSPKFVVSRQNQRFHIRILVPFNNVGSFSPTLSLRLYCGHRRMRSHNLKTFPLRGLHRPPSQFSPRLSVLEALVSLSLSLPTIKISKAVSKSKDMHTDIV